MSAPENDITLIIYDNCLFPSPPLKEEFKLKPSDTLASLRRTIVDKFGYFDDSFEFAPWGVYDGCGRSFISRSERGRDTFTKALEEKTFAELFDVTKPKLLLNLNKTAAYKEGDFPSTKGRTSKTASSLKLPPMNIVGDTSSHQPSTSGSGSSSAHEHERGFIGPLQPGSSGGSVWTRSDAYTDWNKKSDSGFVGLSNQGATCYMNSLLQTLFMTPEFRAALYKWKFDPTKETEPKDHGAAPASAAAAAAADKKKKKEKPPQDPKEARSIPLQLQKLFARLQLSDLRAVKTKELTKSFGWTDADAFTQHDVQELLRVLFDALERVMKGTEQANLINDLYEGQMKDYVQCQVCNHESSRLDKFLDVPLVIRPFGENRILHSVHEALAKFVQSEVLEGDNAYMCDRCQKKVPAKKGLKFLKFPYLLALQLKRFDFDPETFQRVKLNDKVEFPLVLDLAPYLEDGATPTDAAGATPPAPGSGPATPTSPAPAAAPAAAGGASEPRSELPVTSASAAADDEFSDEEEMIDPEIIYKRRRHGDDRSKAKQRGLLGDRPLHQLASAAYAAMGGGRSSSSSKTGLRAPYNPNSKHLYELFSVLIHRGTSMAGHYYAYIKSFETGNWYEFNDSSVSQITVDKLEDTFGEDSRSAAWYGRANAYMLMYRKRDPERNKNGVAASEIPQYLQDAIAADLAEEKKRQEERQRERDSIKFRVYYLTEDRHITVLKTAPIGDILKQAIDMLGLTQHFPPECLRLRNVSDAHTPAEPLDDLTKPAGSIMGILANSKDLLLESRKPDEPFAVYKPTDMTLRLVHYTGEKWATPIFFNIDRNANLGAFQDAIAQKYNIPKEKQLITREAGRSYYASEPMIVKGDGSRLLWDLGFTEGIRIYVEAAEDVNVASPKALQEIERLKNSFSLYHNIPPNKDIDAVITVDKRTTLGELKALLSAKVNIPAGELRVSRTNGWTATELKNLADSLDLCYITDGTMLLLEQGRPLQPGEIKLKFQWYEPETEGKDEKIDDLFECIIDENAPISELKVMLAKKLKDEKNIDIEPMRLRIRESTWRSVGKVYPSNSTFKQCASFLWSGKAFAFQRLQGEETVTSARSLILVVRRWHPSTWTLGPAEEIVSHEDTPLSEFKAQMATKFGITTVSIAKNSWGSTDPLEIADLDWAREKDADSLSTLSSRPFYLHDTDVVVVKDASEPLKELSAEEKKALKRRANVASTKYSGREKALHISTGAS